VDEREAALVFLMTDGVGATRSERLRRRWGSYARALGAVERGASGLSQALRRAVLQALRDRVWERQLAMADAAGDRFVQFGSPEYPELLTEVFRPPVGLFVNGDGLRARRVALAIVGSRAATPRGKLFARELAAALASVGLVIVSGLARGIDTAAHEGALDAEGRTVAVLGSGLDRIYPRENAGLASCIAGSGAVVTEFPYGTEPRSEHFPMRNRIVAGLAAGVLVVEAAERSGALITASIALEEGREVFAVPGAPDDPGSRGPNSLIRAGAKLVETASDVLEELEPAWGPLRDRGHEGAGVAGVRRQGGGDAPRTVEGVLDRTARTAEQIAAMVGTSVRDVLERLIELELAGVALAWPGGRYTRRQTTRCAHTPGEEIR